MALKQITALEVLKETAGEVINKSLCEISGGWLALVNTEFGKRLAFVYQEESSINQLFKDVEKTTIVKDVHLQLMALNANNAAVVRRFVKWAAPTACGNKGTSIGFSDWLGAADAFVTNLFVNRQLKPILVEYTPLDSEVLQRNFLEAVDTATWGILELGYKEGYGANAAGLKSEEEIVKALLYGYSMIGFDCSDKINLSIEKLSDDAIEKRFADFNDTFRAAVNASYLNAEFKVGDSKITFNEIELQRIILEYGEAIMHVQFIYNSYLKNTPWDIDFELALCKPGKVLTPQEHYLIANELQRNGIKLAAICLEPLNEEGILDDNLQVHCEIADTFGYRLSFRNADIALNNPAKAIKYLKGKVHFKLNNILWLSALNFIADKNIELYARINEVLGLNSQNAEDVFAENTCKDFALGYLKVLNVKESNLSTDIKAFLIENKDEYEKYVTKNVKNFLDKI